MSGMEFEPLRIFVHGRPRTKGSLQPDHRKVAPGVCKVGLRESGRYSVPWKNEMIRSIRASGLRMRRHEADVRIDLSFRFARAIPSDDAMPWPTRMTGEWAHGDEDKLRRNALDAITQAGFVKDDCLSIGGCNFKRWTRGVEPAGVLIVVRAATDRDLEEILRLERDA